MSRFGLVGDALIRVGVVDAEGLARAIELRKEQSVTLGRALAHLGLADEAAVAAATAAALRLEYLDGPLPDVDRAAAALLPAEVCRKQRVAPLGVSGSVLRLAVINPVDYPAVQDVEFRTGKKVAAVVVTETWLERMLDALHPEAKAATNYDMLASVTPAGEVERLAGAEYELVDPALLAKDVQLPPIVRLVNLILSDAASAGASDVHIEPHETSLQVRQRVDGLLRDVLTVPSHLQDATVSRLKIISGMDIAERRKPQDGRCRLRFGGRRIDLRVSTLPTQFGEKVVIRLLNADGAVLPLEQLMFSSANLNLVQGFLARPQGMILVTGPTGSGKTSTLYSALNSIRSAANNIVTLEDPIELQLPGVNQMQINPRAGVTFASGLRSILRQDPNVILVGEIRDRETADIALGAAQTGHLLLSTLHTNDASATITRLFDLGIAPFLLAASLAGIVAQRLVRRPCPSCAVPQAPHADVVEKAGGWSQLPASATWLAGSGCQACGQSGLKGRIAIQEVLPVSDEVRDLISSRAAEHMIRRAARRAGMRTLLDDGIDKAARGLTTLDEVVRAVSHEELARAAEVVWTSGFEAHPAVAGAPDAEAAAASAPGTPDGGARKRVLVVEDSPTVLQVVKYFLELEGFEVIVAENGVQGLERALEDLPDVVVSDVRMPGMGGVPMVKALRGDRRMEHVRILMLTSEGSVESETEGLEAGADDYIVKPVEPRRLAARVKALLARSGTRVASPAQVVQPFSDSSAEEG
jgi:type IV pilus assembly protein PilB